MNGLPEDAIRLAISALIVVLIEVGAIGGGIMAAAPKAAVVVPEPVSDDTTSVPSRPRRRRGRYQKQVAVVTFVARFKRRHGRAPSHPELRAAFPAISKAAAQRYRVAA